MKITQSEKATEKDITYMRDDLVNLVNDVYLYNRQSKQIIKQNEQNITNAINYDFDAMRKNEYVENNKKWRKTKIIAGIAGVSGLVGLIAAGAITQNPTFFSPGNLIVGSLLPAFAVCAINYFQEFSPKHQAKLEKIKQARQSTLNKALNSEQMLHDSKEIEVQQAWIDAISDELLKDINPEILQAYSKDKLSQQEQAL